MRLAHRRSSTLALVLLLPVTTGGSLVACANDQFQASGGASDGGVAGEGGSQGDGAPDLDGGDAAPGRREGLVWVTDLPGKFTAAGAQIFPAAGACTRKPLAGTCFDQVCALPHDGAWAKAGVIQITGGKQPMTLVPAPDGGTIVDDYSEVTMPSPGWTPGASFVFSAAGGTVPAFQGIVLAPDSPVVNSPPFAGTQSSDITLTKSADLAITWTGSKNSKLAVSFTPTSPGPASGTEHKVLCYFADSDPPTIPASVLGALGSAGVYGLAGQGSLKTGAGDWDIELVVSVIPTSTFGAVLSGNYTVN